MPNTWTLWQHTKNKAKQSLFTKVGSYTIDQTKELESAFTTAWNDQALEAISIFQDGILPTWQDDKNAYASECRFIPDVANFKVISSTKV